MLRPPFDQAVPLYGVDAALERHRTGRGQGGFDLGAQPRLVGLDREQVSGALGADCGRDGRIGGDGVGVVLDFSRPDKSTDNGFIESLNDKFRAECLNTHWSMLLEDARRKMEDWRCHYDEERPHSAIGYKPPITLLNR